MGWPVLAWSLALPPADPLVLAPTAWGSAGNTAVHNDYDGDGKTDLAVWNGASSAVWTIKRSSDNTTRTETFGTTNDVPVPAYYRR